MRFFPGICTLAIYCSSVLADIYFVYPTGGAIIPGVQNFTIAWENSGLNGPTIGETHQLYLMTGTNDNPLALSTVATDVLDQEDMRNISIPTSIGADVTNA